MYTLVSEFARNDGGYSVTVIGCGGTGGFVAEGLCRILSKRVSLNLVDHDRVETGNLVRQNFFEGELGKFKSEALALRLCNKYKRPIAYSLDMIAGTKLAFPGIVIGCVDNGLARGDIAEASYRGLTPSMGYESWWVDSGNADAYGQVLIGNHEEVAYFADTGICHVLPIPTVQRPDLLYQQPAQPGCADVEQGPTINQAMAFLVVEVVRRIIEGTCEWMQLYLDLKAGTLQPVYAVPESLRGILKKDRIMKGGPPDERRR